jgi:molecular chaperone HtpG
MPARAENHTFQAETQRLLDLMINALYSNKEIFLRELVSNASDALDRLRFEALTRSDMLEDGHKPEIWLETDVEKRTLTVSDNGIGMSREELIDNLGTIARSGTRELLNKLKDSKNSALPPDFIGQFGVGFYSSFMVAKKVIVVTRRAGEAEASRWESSGDGTFKVSDAKRPSHGTSVTLHLKPVDEEDGIEDFTSEYVLGRIVKKYSDFVNYPIKMTVLREKTEQDALGRPKEGAERVIEQETRTLNSMKALWERPASEVGENEYREFYRHIAHDWNEPLDIITQRAEGTLEYHALLFIPSQAPQELYYQAYKSGLQLYVRNVKIIEQCEDLVPRHLRFLRGVVDCTDLPLNVSRETLQHTRQIGQIRKALTKKVLDVLTDMQVKNPEKYLKFWGEFGRCMKEGTTTDHDNRDKLLRLLMFQSSNHPDKLTTLSEYVSRMKPEQEEIYYLTGESREIVENSPHLEAFKDKGYEVLYLVERVDELMTQQLFDFDGKRLKSVGKGVIDFGDKNAKEEAKKSREELEKQYQPLLELLQKKLDEHVKHVRLSTRLTTSAVCLVGAEHDYSPQLEKLLLKGQGGGPKQRRILELNPQHPLLDVLWRRYEANQEDPLLGDYAELLLGQGLLAEGSGLPNPVKFSHQVAKLMVGQGGETEGARASA